jgi:hypothetical protein
MAEIGLVKFATIALHVGQAALPAYRSKFPFGERGVWGCTAA